MSELRPIAQHALRLGDAWVEHEELPPPRRDASRLNGMLMGLRCPWSDPPALLAGHLQLHQHAAVGSDCLLRGLTDWLGQADRAQTELGGEQHLRAHADWQ